MIIRRIENEREYTLKDKVKNLGQYFGSGDNEVQFSKRAAEKFRNKLNAALKQNGIVTDAKDQFFGIGGFTAMISKGKSSEVSNLSDSSSEWPRIQCELDAFGKVPFYKVYVASEYNKSIRKYGIVKIAIDDMENAPVDEVISAVIKLAEKCKTDNICVLESAECSRTALLERRISRLEKLLSIESCKIKNEDSYEELYNNMTRDIESIWLDHFRDLSDKELEDIVDMKHTRFLDKLTTILVRECGYTSEDIDEYGIREIRELLSDIAMNGFAGIRI